MSLPDLEAATLTPDIPAEDYHSWRVVSSSLLNAHRESAAHGKHYMDNGGPPSKDKDIGTATHFAVLEPDLFVKRVVMEPTLPDGSEYNRNTNAYKDAMKAAREAQPGVLILPPKAYRLVLAIRDAVHASREPDAVEARAILRKCDRRELSALWVDPHTGLMCKARYDGFGPGLATDLKTARRTTPHGFATEAAKCGYPIQRALYERGAAECDEPVEDFPHLVLSKTQPFHVLVYRFDAAWMAWAHAEVDRLLLQHKRCVETNEWPAPRGGILPAPRWLLTGSEAPDDGADLEDVAL